MTLPAHGGPIYSLPGILTSHPAGHVSEPVALAVFFGSASTSAVRTAIALAHEVDGELHFSGSGPALPLSSSQFLPIMAKAPQVPASAWTVSVNAAELSIWLALYRPEVALEARR